MATIVRSFVPPELVAPTEIKIDKGVPIPTMPGGTRYPWREMEIGDSFLRPENSNGNVHSNVGQANKRYAPKRFMARKTPKGIRVWRIA